VDNATYLHWRGWFLLYRHIWFDWFDWFDWPIRSHVLLLLDTWLATDPRNKTFSSHPESIVNTCISITRAFEKWSTDRYAYSECTLTFQAMV